MAKGDDFIERFRLKPGARVDLASYDTRDKAGLADEHATKAETVAIAKEIDRLQDSLYAEGKRALLVVLQGTDTSRQGRHDPRRVQRHRPARRLRHRIQAPERGGARARLSLARPPGLPAPRHDRHLQPLALRGRARRRRCASSRPPRRSSSATTRSTPSRGCSSRTARRSSSSCSTSRRRSRRERLQERLDDPQKHWKFNPARPRRPRALGRLPGRLRDHAPPLLDGMGALARRPRRPQMGA